jgi:hypothetical protein
MAPPFVGFLLLACSGSCGTTGGWAPVGVGGLHGGYSSVGTDSSSELWIHCPALLLLLLIFHVFYCYLNIMNLSLAHAPVAWDPRIFVAEEKILPHNLSPSLIMQLLLALPFSLEWIPISIPLGQKWFGESFSLWH